MNRATEATGTTEETYLSRYHSGMLTLLAKMADASIKRDVWDTEPPELWCVDRTTSTLGVRLPSLAAREMPLNPQVWEGRHSAEVMHLLAERLGPIMRASGSLVRRPTALAFLGESWTLKYPDDATDEQVEQAQLFARARGVADHPWAVESKSVMAVSADGWRYSVVRRRVTHDGPAYAEPPDGGITGRYPVALDALLAAMRARP